MSTLRLSYDHLPSHLKNCFAYCSLYPKGSWLTKKNLIYLWIAHGYITPRKDETLEMAGNAYFMELFRRSFFQEAQYDDEKEITRCKMHDLVHDLAEDVSGEETCIITTQEKDRSYKKIRHLCVDYGNNASNIDKPLLLIDAERLRTCLYTHYSGSPQLLVEQLTKFRFLRVLGLGNQGLSDVHSSIGELKYLRYLDLSGNDGLRSLPNSITKLVNLITLDVSECRYLVELPKKIGELVSLRHLINLGCQGLRCIPPSFGELTSIEHLSEFKVTKSDDTVGEASCGLNALGRLNLGGSLKISFDCCVQWSRDEVLFERGQVPNTLEALTIDCYPTMRMLAWWTDVNSASMLPKLRHLSIRCSSHVEHLPSLRRLPCLESLHLNLLPGLEFIEEDEALSTTPFLPSLCTLKIWEMLNLKGLSRGTNAIMFPCLSKLEIRRCPSLLSMPIDAPRLKTLSLYSIRPELFDRLASRPCASGFEEIEFSNCAFLTNFSGEGLTSLRRLKFVRCLMLRKVRVAPNTVEEFTILDCPHLELWEQTMDHEMSVDWASFAKLRVLTLPKQPEVDLTRLPELLQQLMSLGKLRVQYSSEVYSRRFPQSLG